MDIEIVNKSVVDSACNEILNSNLSELNTEIDELSQLLSQVKSRWESNGMDKESYILELEKQVNNLTTLEGLMRNLAITIQNYSDNIGKISKRTVSDAAIGDNFANFDVTSGYISASNAVNDTNSVNINKQYVNNKSTVKSFAVVEKDGNVSNISSDNGMTLEEFAAENNVSVDNIAVDIGKNGESQVWVSAADLGD